MTLTWAHAGSTITAAFLASLVEFVEALTVVLAVGSTRGWRSPLLGTFVAVMILLGLIAVLGESLTRLPLQTTQLAVGVLLLLFGMRWLCKAILRTAGVIPLHDEAAIFAAQSEAMQRLGGAGRWDRIAFATAFQITMLEGIEVVFIVIAVGAGGPGLLWPACLGAVTALLVVAVLGLVIHRPLARVPENGLKFVVGLLLSAFGCFWVGEGLGLAWPGGDWSILALIAGFLVTALVAAPLARDRSRKQRVGLARREA